MSDYSSIDRFLHYLVLNSRPIQNVLWDVERFIFDNKVKPTHGVYVLGMPRAGTTAVMKAVYGSGRFASLKYNDMPFAVCPNLWATITKFHQKQTISKERSHLDGVTIDYSSPESFEGIFWSLIQPQPKDRSSLDRSVISEEEISSLKAFHRVVCRRYRKNRYLAKNNNAILNFDQLSKELQDYLFLVMYRCPVTQSQSLLRQHTLLQSATKFSLDYMGWLQHFEFGPDHLPFIFNNNKTPAGDRNDIQYWVDRWSDCYEFVADCLEAQGFNNVILLRFEDLMQDNQVWKKLCALLDIEVVDSGIASKTHTVYEGSERADLTRALKILARLEKLKFQ